MRLVTLCFVIASALCNRVSRNYQHTIPAIRQADHDLAMHELAPFASTARMLFEHRPELSSTLQVDFAHALLHMNHRFARGPRDHTWETTIAHFACEAVIDAEEELVSACTRHVKLECTCGGLTSLLRACHNHVIPWTSDEVFCDDVLNATRCGHPHFLHRICASSRHRHKHLRSRKPSPTLLMHEHGASPKHRSWYHHTKDHEHKQFEIDIAHKMQRAHQQQAHEHAKMPDNVRQKQDTRRSDRPPTKSTQIAALFRYDHFETIHHMRKGPGTNVSMCTSHESIRTMVQMIFTNATHVLVPTDRQASRMLLDRDGCDLLFTWPAVAELIHLHPCPQEVGMTDHVPAMCSDYLHSRHHGNRDRLFFQNPQRNILELTPHDPVLADTSHAQNKWHERQTCETLHQHSRVGKTPGHHIPTLRDICKRN